MSASQFSEYSDFGHQFSAQKDPAFGQAGSLQNAHVKDIDRFKSQLNSGSQDTNAKPAHEQLALALLSQKTSPQFCKSPELSALIKTLGKDAQSATALFTEMLAKQGTQTTLTNILQSYTSLQYEQQLGSLLEQCMADEGVQHFKNQLMDKHELVRTSQLVGSMRQSFASSCLNGDQLLLGSFIETKPPTTVESKPKHQDQVLIEDLRVKLLATGSLTPSISSATQAIVLHGLAYKLSDLLKGCTAQHQNQNPTQSASQALTYLAAILLKHANGIPSGAYEQFKKTDKSFTTLDLQVNKTLEKTLLHDKALLLELGYTPSKTELAQTILEQTYQAFNQTRALAGTAEHPDIGHSPLIDKAVINFDAAIFCDAIRRRNDIGFIDNPYFSPHSQPSDTQHSAGQQSSQDDSPKDSQSQPPTDELIDDVCKQISVSEKDHNQAWAVRIELKDELFKNVVLDMKGDYYKIEVTINTPDADESALFLKLVDDLKRSLEASSNKDIYVKVSTENKL